MRKWMKILIGIASIWPGVFIFGTLLFELRMVMHGRMQDFLKVITEFHLGWIALPTIALYYGLIIGYQRHISNNSSIPNERRRFWKMLISRGSFFSMPYYWYRYIWKSGIN